MSLFLSRSRRSSHFLEWRVGIFTVGAALALGGIYLETRWMTGTAIVVLLGGVLLRFAAGAGDGSPRGGEDQEGEGEEDAGPIHT